ncbi:hypothetical protein [Streptomyces hundungensis]|uniref:hypothetical protein n=1 Tax=Streptomyces hundungensis TaxID=1077946 RepID=UPI003403FF48
MRQPIVECPQWCSHNSPDSGDAYHDGQQLPPPGELVHFSFNGSLDVPRTARYATASLAVHAGVELAAVSEDNGQPGPTLLRFQGCDDDWFTLSALNDVDDVIHGLTRVLALVVEGRAEMVRGRRPALTG